MLLGVLRRSIVHRLPTSFKFGPSTPYRMANTLPKLALFEAIAAHDPNHPVVIHSASGRRFTYGGLLGDVVQACNTLRHDAGSRSLVGQRIAFLVENGYDYVGAKYEILSADSLSTHDISDSPCDLRHQQHRRPTFAYLSRH